MFYSQNMKGWITRLSYIYTDLIQATIYLVTIDLFLCDQRGITSRNCLRINDLFLGTTELSEITLDSL